MVRSSERSRSGSWALWGLLGIASAYEAWSMATEQETLSEVIWRMNTRWEGLVLTSSIWVFLTYHFFIEPKLKKTTRN